MSAFVHYVGVTEWKNRVFIEVNKKIALQKCENAPSFLQGDCTENIAIFEDHEKSKRVPLAGEPYRAPDSIKEKVVE